MILSNKTKQFTKEDSSLSQVAKISSAILPFIVYFIINLCFVQCLVDLFSCIS